MLTKVILVQLIIPLHYLFIIVFLQFLQRPHLLLLFPMLFDALSSLFLVSFMDEFVEHAVVDLGVGLFRHKHGLLRLLFGTMESWVREVLHNYNTFSYLC